MKYQKMFVSLTIFISICMFLVSFTIEKYTNYLGEQATQVTTDLLQTILKYNAIANYFYAFAIILLALLIAALAYQKYKKLCKKG